MMMATAVAFYYEIGEMGSQGATFRSGDDVSPVLSHGEQYQVHQLQKDGTLPASSLSYPGGLVSIFVVVATAPNIMGFFLLAAYVVSGPISTVVYYRRAALAPKEDSETPPPKLTNSQGLDLGGGGEA